MPTYLRNPSYYYYYDFFFFFFFYYFKLLLRDDDHDNDHEANATHSQLLRIPCCYMLPLLLVPSRSLQYYSQYRVCCYYSTIVFNVCVCVCVFFHTCFCWRCHCARYCSYMVDPSFFGPQFWFFGVSLFIDLLLWLVSMCVSVDLFGSFCYWALIVVWNQHWTIWKRTAFVRGRMYG